MYYLLEIFLKDMITLFFNKNIIMLEKNDFCQFIHTIEQLFWLFNKDHLYFKITYQRII